MKKLLALVLALVMTLSLCTISNAAYSDAADVDYKEAVDVMSAIGVLEGADGKFNPDGILTREQAAKIIAYMLLGKKAADSLSTASAPFTDVAANRWSAGAIAYCASEGILAGVGNNMFAPTDTLTGYQFSKMLLVALGYDAGNEGMTGLDWQINVAKLVIDLKLNDGMTDVVLSQGLSRQAAAKLAFNTLDEYVVRYTGGVTVNAGNDTTVKVGATLTTTGNKFGAVYFADLSSSTPDDDYGRPATKWVWKNQSVGTYAKTPAHVYTADMDTTAGKKTVKADLGDYVMINDPTAAVHTDATDFAAYTASGKLNTDSIAAVTGNGVEVEVYVTKNVITDVVVITPVKTTVSKVATDKVTFANGKTIEDDEDLFAEASKLEKGDIVVLYVDTTNTTVIDLYKATAAAGKFTKIADTKYTVGGTAYEALDAYSGITTDLATSDLNTIMTVYLDKYGYVVAVEDGDGTDATYALILDATASISRGEYDYAAKLLFTDGTTKWVNVAKYDSNVIADGDMAKATFEGKKDNFVSFTEKDGAYELSELTTDNTTTGINKGATSMTGSSLAVSNSTVFVVKQADKSYKVYTGVKNVPTMVITATDALALNDSGSAPFVVVNKFSTTNAKDQIFIFKDDVQGTYKDGSVTVETFKAIVNGEVTTVDVDRTVTNMVTSGTPDTANIGLFVDSSYSNDGYVTTAGTANATSSKVIKYTAAASDSLTDITVKNGIVKFDKASDASAVLADEYNLWYIAGTSEKVEALNVDKTATFGLGKNYPAMASGDYVIYVLDADNYVTDLYFYDADGTL